MGVSCIAASVTGTFILNSSELNDKGITQSRGDESGAPPPRKLQSRHWSQIVQFARAPGVWKCKRGVAGKKSRIDKVLFKSMTGDQSGQTRKSQSTVPPTLRQTTDPTM